MSLASLDRGLYGVATSGVQGFGDMLRALGLLQDERQAAALHPLAVQQAQANIAATQAGTQARAQATRQEAELHPYVVEQAKAAGRQATLALDAAEQLHPGDVDIQKARQRLQKATLDAQQAVADWMASPDGKRVLTAQQRLEGLRAISEATAAIAQSKNAGAAARSFSEAGGPEATGQADALAQTQKRDTLQALQEGGYPGRYAELQMSQLNNALGTESVRSWMVTPGADGVSPAQKLQELGVSQQVAEALLSTDEATLKRLNLPEQVKLQMSAMRSEAEKAKLGPALVRAQIGVAQAEAAHEKALGQVRSMPADQLTVLRTRYMPLKAQYEKSYAELLTKSTKDYGPDPQAWPQPVKLAIGNAERSIGFINGVLGLNADGSSPDEISAEELAAWRAKYPTLPEDKLREQILEFHKQAGIQAAGAAQAGEKGWSPEEAKLAKAFEAGMYPGRFPETAEEWAIAKKGKAAIASYRKRVNRAYQERQGARADETRVKQGLAPKTDTYKEKHPPAGMYWDRSTRDYQPVDLPWTGY